METTSRNPAWRPFIENNSPFDAGTSGLYIAHGHRGNNAAAACDAVRAKGGTVTREAGPVKGGTTVIAFVQDPDGYKIELIQR